MELVRELVAFNFPEVAAPLRTVDRSAYHDVMLRQIQVKNDTKFLSLLIRNNRMDEAEEILACPHPAISHAIHESIKWAA
jgi:ankyrin repeat protein